MDIIHKVFAEMQTAILIAQMQGWPLKKYNFFSFFKQLGPLKPRLDFDDGT